jgi:hypothetical protein
MINLDNVKQMLAQGSNQTLTLYLDVDASKQENQATQPAWRIFIKDALQEAENTAKDADGWQQIRERVEQFAESYKPEVKACAAFFTADEQNIYELPIPVEQQWSFGKPLIVPLLWAIDEYEQYLIVMVDKEKAELLTAYLGGTTVESRLESDIDEYDFQEKTLMPATSAVAGGHPVTQGSNREAYQNMINEHIARFHRDVVQQVEEFARKHPGIRVIIGGEEQSAHAVHNLLPEHFSGSLVGILPIPMKLSDGEILQHIQEPAQEYERNRELELLNQVIDFAKSGGRGALGRKAVDEALTMRRVELLLLPYPLDNTAEASKLSARAFESGGSVELLHGEAGVRLTDEGGVAARLYYAL